MALTPIASALPNPADTNDPQAEYDAMKKRMEAMSSMNADAAAQGSAPQTSRTLPGSTMQATGGLLSQQYTPTTKDAIERNVQNLDTSSGQMTKIMGAQSDLMRDAQARAKGQMSSRGLLNTSMTAGEVQRGMMDAAKELATHDASTYLKQGLENQAAQNQQISNENAYARDLAAGQFETDMGEYVADAALGRDIVKDTEATTQDIRYDDASTDNDIRADLQASINNMNESAQDYRELLGEKEYDSWVEAGHQEAMQKAALDGKYMDAYDSIINNADMTDEEKEIRLDQIDELFAGVYEGIGIDFNYMPRYRTGYLAVTDAVMRSPVGGGDQAVLF